VIKDPVIGVGIIGTGFGAAVQLPGFLGLPEVRVVGIASKDGKKTEELTKKYSLPKKFSSPEDLIGSKEVDLVSVAVPPFAQEELIRLVIAAGKSVLCEKPFTNSSGVAQNLYDAAQNAGIVHAVDFEFRELPAIKSIKEKIETGNIGKNRSAEISWLVGFWADPERPWRWQCDRSAGGGVTGALGVHMFDIVEWFFGPVKELKAETLISIKKRKDISGISREVTAEDHASIELICETGIPIKIILSNSEPAGTGLSMNIRGDKGIIKLESSTQEYGRGLKVKEVADEKSLKFVELPADIAAGLDSRIPPFQSLAGRLVKAILKKETLFQPSFLAGLRAQKIREAVLESSASGKWVKVDEN